MIINNLIDNFNQICFDFKISVKEFYQNSNFYDKKISKTKDITFVYKPSPIPFVFNSKISKEKI